MRNYLRKRRQIWASLAVKWPSLQSNALLRIRCAGNDGSSIVNELKEEDAHAPLAYRG